MVDAFLTIAAVVILILLLVVNTYLLALYQHPEDRGFGASVAPKIIVVLNRVDICNKIKGYRTDFEFVSSVYGLFGYFKHQVLISLRIFLKL